MDAEPESTDVAVRLTHRKSGARARDRAAWKDLRTVLELGALTVMPWLLPERTWRRAAQAWEAAFAGHAKRVAAERAPAFRAVLGPIDDARAAALSLKVSATRTEHHMQILRAHRPGGWRPELDLAGEEHVRAALEAGGGAVLWIAHFSFNALATKMALHRAGLAAHHLSRAEHGFSKTAFGVRWLNPIRVKAELPHLGGRIVIEPARPARAMLEARRRLADNGLVSITAGHWEGATIASVSVGDGDYPLATGAPALAALTGAPLLPVFTTRAPGTRVIRVEVDRPIEIPSGLSREEALGGAVEAYAGRLVERIRRCPDQWRGWSALKLDRPGAWIAGSAELHHHRAERDDRHQQRVLRPDALL